jgi:hypothetical protein
MAKVIVHSHLLFEFFHSLVLGAILLHPQLDRCCEGHHLDFKRKELCEICVILEQITKH